MLGGYITVSSNPQPRFPKDDVSLLEVKFSTTFSPQSAGSIVHCVSLSSGFSFFFPLPLFCKTLKLAAAACSGRMGKGNGKCDPTLLLLLLCLPNPHLSRRSASPSLFLLGSSVTFSAEYEPTLPVWLLWLRERGEGPDVFIRGEDLRCSHSVLCLRAIKRVLETERWWKAWKCCVAHQTSTEDRLWSSYSRANHLK